MLAFIQPSLNYRTPAPCSGSPTNCESIVRETYEELGITVAPASLAAAGVMFRRFLEPRVDFFFTADEWDGTPRICEPHKCTALAWADPDKLPSGTLEYISAAIANLRQGRHFSERGWTPAFSQ